MTDNRPRMETYDVTGDAPKRDNTRQQRDSSRGDRGNKLNKEQIKAEVEKALQRGPITTSFYRELSDKYGDDVADQIFKRMGERLRKIQKHASKLAMNIYSKYKDGTRPTHEILEKMMRYKTKHGWSDLEFDEFRRELSYLLSGNRALEIDYNQGLSAFRSKINRALGGQVTIEEGLKIKDSEQGVLSEILSMYEKSSTLHRTVFMHSIVYEDMDLVALTGKYNRDKHIASNHIHPLIACMYLPKFDLFEIHTLYANFGSIIKCRYERKPIVTEPDLLLYYDITSDPNDVVCDLNSPITDIRNRYRVQIQLWETVLKLRNGNYYETEPFSQFMAALNACRNNLYDNADLAYSQDEGAMLRRFMSVWSLRPIYSIASMAGGPCPFGLGTIGADGNPMNMSLGLGMVNGQNMLPFNNQPIYTITSVPMMTLQIPHASAGINIGSYTLGDPNGVDSLEPKSLNSAIKQTIWINENKTIIPKEQSIIYSKGVLIFYVNRRVPRIQIKTFSNPLSFSQLPLTMSNFERLNNYPVNVPDRINLRDEIYNLRSVVAINETEIRQGDRSTSIITGCTGLLTKARNLELGIFDPQYYLYDPFGASIPVRHPDWDVDEKTRGYITNNPITMLSPMFSPVMDGTDSRNASFYDRASKNGTIFFYAKPGGYSGGNDGISIFGP
jgi:hypothetical protein